MEEVQKDKTPEEEEDDDEEEEGNVVMEGYYIL